MDAVCVSVKGKTVCLGIVHENGDDPRRTPQGKKTQREKRRFYARTT